MIKKATHHDQLFYSPLRSFATETSPRHLIGHKNKESSSNIQNVQLAWCSPPIKYTNRHILNILEPHKGDLWSRVSILAQQPRKLTRSTEAQIVRERQKWKSFSRLHITHTALLTSTMRQQLSETSSNTLRILLGRRTFSLKVAIPCWTSYLPSTIWMWVSWAATNHSISVLKP